LLELNDAILRQMADKTINRHIAISGVQPKLSVTIKKGSGNARLTIVGLWGEYILKPQHSSYFFMPETEDLTMHIASVYKIVTCRHTLLRATDGTLVYIAKRFDRKDGEKIHTEDLCQLSELLTENKYKSSYERAGKLVLKYCTNSLLDALKYFELVLFSYLAGNNDMHLKNFSVVHTESGILFSPAYDLLNVNLVNPKDDEEMGLTLNGKKKKIKLADFISLAEKLSIPKKAMENSFKKFSDNSEQVRVLINRSFLNDEYKERYWQIWQKKQQVFVDF